MASIDELAADIRRNFDGEVRVAVEDGDFERFLFIVDLCNPVPCHEEPIIATVVTDAAAWMAQAPGWHTAEEAAGLNVFADAEDGESDVIARIRSFAGEWLAAQGN